MNFEDIQFPLYRKYRNNRNYFKIINPRLFEELIIIGKSVQLRTVEVRQFPEQNFIRDLVYSYSEMAEEIGEHEYEKVREGLISRD